MDRATVGFSNGDISQSSPSGGALMNSLSPQVVLGGSISPQMLEEMERKRLKKKRREKIKRLRNASSSKFPSDIEGSTPKAFIKKHKHKHHKHHKHRRHRHHNGSSITNGCKTQDNSDRFISESAVADNEEVSVLALEESKPSVEETLVLAQTAVVAPLSNIEEIPEVAAIPSDMPVKTESSKSKLKLSIKKLTDKPEVTETSQLDVSLDDNEKENGVVKEDGKKTKKQNKIKKKSAKKEITAMKNSKPETPTKASKKVVPSGTPDAHSKMAAFLPVQQLWAWYGKGHKRPGSKGKGRKEFYKCIQRGDETISVGDCAVFLSTGQPDQPFIGRIEALWEAWNSNKVVRVKWFYHPQETIGCPPTLKYPGALFESDHCDENDVQTIARKCIVLPVQEFANRFPPNSKVGPRDTADLYYLAGFYDPSKQSIELEKGVV